ncbi:MAG TPA: metal-dependent hydrolase [Verrucomicrobiae bacterium]
MDPVTHTVLGASFGYALFQQRLGKRAAVVGALAGATPDIDVLIKSATDPLLAVELHRHFTHALPFAPIGALIVASLWFLRPAQRQDWKPLWLCALVAYVSHCLLDAATSYGTLLLWPFTRQRYGWDWISIIDLLFTVPLLVLLIIGVVRQKARFVQTGLVWGAAYMLLGVWQHQKALDAQAQLALQRGHGMEKREAMPTMANNTVWRSLYLAKGQLYSDRIRVGWFSGATVKEGTHLPLVTVKELTEAESTRDGKAKAFERFTWFSEGWVARSPVDATVLGDMRYSLSTEAFDPIWGIQYTAADEAIAVKWVNRSRDRKIDRQKFWAEIAGKAEGYEKISERGK